MKTKTCGALGVATLILTACGGGGGGGGGSAVPSLVRPTPPTTMSGIVTPPVSPGNGAATASTSIRTPPNSTGTWNSVVQSMDYTFDPASALATPASLKVTNLNIKPVDTQAGNSVTITTGVAYPTDSTVGQPTSITNTQGGISNTVSIATGAIATLATMATAAISTFAGLPTAILTNNITVAASGYVIPYSPILNPSGYVYQTFGGWSTINPTTAVMTENYFSAGVVSVLGALPVVGTAQYTGKAAGSYVNAANNDPASTYATMNATANFASRSVAFSTSGTTSLSNNAAAGVLPTANAGLDISGTLSYAAGSNTFTGSVATVNGMTGNATGRFYGPGIIAPTANQVLGAPPEIGGTFAVMNSGIGAMHGAFCGSGSHPPTVVPIPTTISGTVTAPTAPFADITPVLTFPTIVTPPNNTSIWNAIVQHMDYTFYPALAGVPLTQKVSALNLMPVDTRVGNTQFVTTGAAYPTDPALGQTVSITNTIGVAFPISTLSGAVVSQTTLAGLPAVTLTDNLIKASSSYVLPFSATMNPTGYTYQTFGSWQSTNVAGVLSEYYFSGGIATAQLSLPVLGTASYTGVAAGSYVNAVTNDPSKTTATMNATANFAARTVAFATTGTTSLSNNAVAGTLPAANAALNMSGTLSYAAGNNTFTGAVATTNGMSGNATGRFYGPGIVAATPTKAVGAPPEIGGTFAVMATSVGAMQGAFGGK